MSEIQRKNVPLTIIDRLPVIATSCERTLHGEAERVVESEVVAEGRKCGGQAES